MKSFLEYNIYDYIPLLNKSINSLNLNNKIIENFKKEKEKEISIHTGTSIAVLLILSISLILWVWGVVMTVIRWNKLNKNKRIICILFILLTWSTIPIISPFLSPIIVLLTIYSPDSKQSKKRKNK